DGIRDKLVTGVQTCALPIFALLKANPSLITNAIEEFLRYDSSVQMTGRVTLEDIDDLGGRKIPKGESVLCLLGAANHDPAVYPRSEERRVGKEGRARRVEME